MGDLSAHFSEKEFYCKGKTCGCPKAKPDSIVVLLLEDGRSHFKLKYKTKVRVRVNSAIRCYDHNETVQKQANPNYVPGSSSSRHMGFDAVDVVFERLLSGEWVKIDTQEVYDYYNDRFVGMLGLGIYDTFNHIDGRMVPARWDLRTPDKG